MLGLALLLFIAFMSYILGRIDSDTDCLKKQKADLEEKIRQNRIAIDENNKEIEKILEKRRNKA